MAEQEACTALVDQATKGEEPTTPTTPSTGQLEGESQLLPLLKGLLGAPENDITPDSGTESGEDQRSTLIAEVQNALDKLSNSLKSDQTDITPERRSSLLQLVTKLQAGLSGTTNERRASTVSSGGRFQKKKNRQSRHTVGVSKEELADARRLIQEISFNELTPSSSNTKVQLLSKQNSESSVPTSSASSSYKNIHQGKIKNATPKPFSSSNSTASSVQTPTEPFDAFDLIFGEDRDTVPQDSTIIQQKSNTTFASAVKLTQPNLERTMSVDSNTSNKSAYKAVKQAAAIKVQKPDTKDQKIKSEMEEDNSTTVKGAKVLENALLQSNPIYSKPQIRSTHEERSSRFDTQSKKNRMKRANTIDIPKPLVFYEDEDESDSDHENDAEKRRDSYYALRGPVRVSNPHTKKIVPTFEPKTDSDKKFLAFISKHNDNTANKGSMWANNHPNNNWGSKFGNIKNTFENASDNDARSFWKSADDNVSSKTSTNQFGPKISRRSARNLQQMFEEKQKDNQKSVTWSGQSNVVTGSLKVKPESDKPFRVIPQPLPVNQFSHAPQSAFRPIRKPELPSKRASLVFSPEGNEIVKSELKENNQSVFLYSPKPLSSSVESSTVTSPVASKPWAASAGGSRVLSMAASKFTQQTPQEPPKPRKLSKDNNQKLFIPVNQRNSSVIDRTTPYLPKSAETKSSTVRKLSGQYENIDNKAAENPHQHRPQTYQIKTNVVESQYTPPVRQYQPQYKAPTQPSISQPPPQNYSIRYEKPQNYSHRYEQPITQPLPQPNYSIRFDKPQTQQLPGSTLQNQPQNYSIRYEQPQNQSQKQYHPHNIHESAPQNYSIRYDQPRVELSQPQPTSPLQNYTIRYEQPQIKAAPLHSPDNTSKTYTGSDIKPSTQFVSPQVLQNQSVKKPPELSVQQDTQYTSTCEFKPAHRVPIQAIEPVVQSIGPAVHPSNIERQISNESLHEHIAVSSKVMSGPVSQQAVTVRQKSPMNRDQHDMEAAFNLRNSLQKVNKQEPIKMSATAKPNNSRSPSQSFSYKSSSPKRANETKNPTTQSFKYKSEVQSSDSFKYKMSDCPKPTVSPSSFKFGRKVEEGYKEVKNCGVVKPMQQQKPTPIYNNISRPQEKLQINDKGQSVVTGQFHIPLINVKSPESPRPPNLTKVLSKSDSWHQICQSNQSTAEKPAHKAGLVVKSKSSHSLAVPKLFEAGMSKEEMSQKRKTMEAFLTGSRSPLNEGKGDSKVVKRSINRIKTSQKMSTQSRVSGGLCRSRTLPDIVCPDLLDESNVDKSFDELFESC